MTAWPLQAVAIRLTQEQVNSWRLSKHHLIRRASRRELASVVSTVCGIQAQVLPAAGLAVRARVEGVNQQDFLDALWKDHTLVKTWCMRGTLHILAFSDLPLYVAALRTKLEETKTWLKRDGGVTPSEVDAIAEEITRALARGRLSREELSREVERRLSLSPGTREYLRSPWGVLLRPAAYQGGLAFGEGSGSKVTFVGPSKWVPRWVEPPTDEAFAALFRRFLHCYGPATTTDFARWWGSLRNMDGSVLQAAEDDLEEVNFKGRKGLMLRHDAEEASGVDAPSGVRLLPSFDCYAMHYAPRELFVSETYRNRIFRRTAGWNYPVIISNGKAAGVWNLKRLTRRAEVNVEVFRSLNSAEKKGVEEETFDIGKFLGFPARVRYVSGGTSPHP